MRQDANRVGYNSREEKWTPYVGKKVYEYGERAETKRFFPSVTENFYIPRA